MQFFPPSSAPAFVFQIISQSGLKNLLIWKITKGSDKTLKEEKVQALFKSVSSFFLDASYMQSHLWIPWFTSHRVQDCRYI